MEFTVETLAATLTTLVNGAAGEAGKLAWSRLTDMVRRRSSGRAGGEAEPELERAAAEIELLERASGDDPTVGNLATALRDGAIRDPELAAWLAAWLREAPSPGAVHNTISGRPRIQNALQAGQIGSVTFGQPNSHPRE